MSIEKKLTYLKDTKALIRKKLNRFGINVSSENTFRSYVDFLDEILNRYPKSRGQGTEITLENTIEATFTKFDVEGNSEQESTEGYQLLKYPYVATTTTVNGVTFTDNGDGSLKINGTASEEARFNLQWDNKVPAGSYSYIVFNLPNNCFANYYTIGNKYGEDVGNRTSDTEINLGSSIVVPAGVSVSNVTVYPMLVSGTYTRETIPNWEKYTGGIASPNPNYEQPIESAGDNGSINEKIQNKNFAWNNTGNVIRNGLTFKVNDDKSITINGTATNDVYYVLRNDLSFKAGETWSLSGCNGGSSTTYGLYCYNIGDLYNGSKTTTLTSDFVNRQLGIIVKSGTTLNNVTFYPQLELNSQATDYVPPQEQDYSIEVQQPMRSIGDVRDGFVKQNGVWYERHYIGRKIFDGTENWGVDGYYYYLNNETYKIYSFSLCNYAIYKEKSAITNPTAIFALTKSGSNFIEFSKYNFSSVADFKAWLAELYANGTPLYIDYVLATPTLIACTSEQINVLENLPSTYKDFTIIQSEDETEAYLEVAGLKED